MQYSCDVIAVTAAGHNRHTLYCRLSGAIPEQGYAFLSCAPTEEGKIQRITLHWRYASTEGSWARQSIRIDGGRFRPTLVYFRDAVSACGLSLQSTSPAICPIGIEIKSISHFRALLSLSVTAYQRARASGLSPLEVMKRKLKYVKLTGKGNVAERLNDHHHRHTSQAASYSEWLETHEHPFAVLDDEARLADLGARPRITVLCDARNASEAELRLTVDALKAQLYQDWTLLVLTQGLRVSGEAQVQYLDCTRSADDPIRPFEKCETDWVLICPAGASFPASALLEFVHAVQMHPAFCVWYSDTDERTDRLRSNPRFKPDWNRELFYSHNYIGPAIMVNRELAVSRLGCNALDQCTDADHLLMRIVETGNENRIGHVAKMLVTFPGEAASRQAARDPGRLERHLANRGISATVERSVGQMLRVKYEVPVDAPDVALIIPTRDRMRLLKQCVDSILEKTLYENYTVTIVDNASAESSTYRYLVDISGHPRVRILRDPRPFNFSSINNHAVAHTKSTLIALVNNDVEVISAEWLGEMVSFAIQPDVGCVGAKLLYSNDQIQHAGVLCGVGNVAAHAHRYFDCDAPGYCNRLQVAQEYSAVTAACMVLRREVFDQVGGFDEHNLSVAYNDVDLCLKVRRAGYRNIYTPHAVLYHYESLTRGLEDTDSKRRRYAAERAHMWETWGDELRNDPHYNSNLTRQREDFTLEHSQ